MRRVSDIAAECDGKRSGSSARPVRLVHVCRTGSERFVLHCAHCAHHSSSSSMSVSALADACRPNAPLRELRCRSAVLSRRQRRWRCTSFSVCCLNVRLLSPPISTRTSRVGGGVVRGLCDVAQAGRRATQVGQRTRRIHMRLLYLSSH